MNEYFTEMSDIAISYGATVDKFIGDAILAFFGDPETKGVAEDAKLCLEMAIAMQRRLAELNREWRRRGIEDPFRVRMGVNTGYCNVGNFGSADRMDYTIIGAEANLAARLESIAEPGGIVMSYETFALVQDTVRAEKLEAMTFKGIHREVMPYAVLGVLDDDSLRQTDVINEYGNGVNIFIDTGKLADSEVERVRGALENAISMLARRSAVGT